MSPRLLYPLCVLPLVAELIESGGLPVSARDLVTDVSAAAVIGLLVTALARQQERLSTLAETDPLTGLRNRRLFLEDLAREVGRARRMKSTLALAYLDVDGFTLINERYGRGEGDALLFRLSNLLRQSTRQDIDCCYRMGGDEFAVLMPATDGPGSVTVAQRIRRMSREEPFALSRLGVSLTIALVELAEGESHESYAKRAESVLADLRRGGSGRTTTFAARANA